MKWRCAMQFQLSMWFLLKIALMLQPSIPTFLTETNHITLIILEEDFCSSILWCAGPMCVTWRGHEPCVWLIEWCIIVIMPAAAAERVYQRAAVARKALCSGTGCPQEHNMHDGRKCDSWVRAKAPTSLRITTVQHMHLYTYESALASGLTARTSQHTAFRIIRQKVRASATATQYRLHTGPRLKPRVRSACC